MDIKCENCQGQFKIPDEKLPKDKVVAIPCPKCKEKITVDTRVKAAASEPKAVSVADEVGASQYDASEKPFDYLDEGTLTALICDSDSGTKARVRAALENMRYRVTEASTAREALKAMRFHIFDMVVLSELFDTDSPDNNHVLKFLGRLAISIRRQVFVVLLSSEHRTMDNMAAFTKSVNIIINTKNINEIGNIIGAGFSDNNGFYRIFNDTLKKLGRL